MHSAARHPLKLDIEKRLRTALPAKGTPRRDNDSAHKARAKRTNVLPSRTENLAVRTQRRLGTKHTRRSTSPAQASHRIASPGPARRTNTAHQQFNVQNQRSAHRRRAIVAGDKHCHARSTPGRHQARTAPNITHSSSTSKRLTRPRPSDQRRTPTIRHAKPKRSTPTSCHRRGRPELPRTPGAG